MLQIFKWFLAIQIQPYLLKAAQWQTFELIQCQINRINSRKRQYAFWLAVYLQCRYQKLTRFLVVQKPEENFTFVGLFLEFWHQERKHFCPFLQNFAFLDDWALYGKGVHIDKVTIKPNLHFFEDWSESCDSFIHYLKKRIFILTRKC